MSPRNSWPNSDNASVPAFRILSGKVASARAVLDIYNRNIFPDMKVTWGKYPLNIGHTDFPGCFRCHDDAHSASDAKGDPKKITQDCGACHNLLAVDEPNPKILNDIGLSPQ
jgi:hypothetical protein